MIGGALLATPENDPRFGNFNGVGAMPWHTRWVGPRRRNAAPTAWEDQAKGPITSGKEISRTALPPTLMGRC
jgi:hypothetical protein